MFWGREKIQKNKIIGAHRPPGTMCTISTHVPHFSVSIVRNVRPMPVSSCRGKIASETRKRYQNGQCGQIETNLCRLTTQHRVARDAIGACCDVVASYRKRVAHPRDATPGTKKKVYGRVDEGKPSLNSVLINGKVVKKKRFGCAGLGRPCSSTWVCLNGMLFWLDSF